MYERELQFYAQKNFVLETVQSCKYAIENLKSVNCFWIVCEGCVPYGPL